MANLLDLLTGYRSPLDRLPAQPTGVRTSGGEANLAAILAGAQLQQQQKSQYEPTLAPGERRTPEELQAMLANVIEAAGMAAVPGVGPHEMARQNPSARRRVAREPSKTSPEGRGLDLWIATVARRLQGEGLSYGDSVIRAHEIWREQEQLAREYEAARATQ